MAGKLHRTPQRTNAGKLMLRKYLIAMIGLMTGLGSTLAIAEETTGEEERLIEEAQARVQVFAKTLRAQLISAMQEGGPEKAVAVCSEQAPKIAKDLSEDGWTLARTSLKVRNPENLPDSWERDVMLQFKAAMQSGAQEATLFKTQFDGARFRYMQAIPTGGPCLACHGSNIPQGLRQTIKAQYPHDAATGFAPGELRGAFTLQHTL